MSLPVFVREPNEANYGNALAQKPLDSIFIPNIEKKIVEVLDRLSLKPKITPREFINATNGMKHRYFSACYRQNKKYFFSALLKKSAKNKRKFSRELEMADFLLKKRQSLPDYFPYYIDFSSIRSQHPWLLTEWTPAPVLEDRKNAEKSIRSLEKKEIQNLVKTMFYFNHHFLDSKIDKIIKIDKFKVDQNYKKLLKILTDLKSNGIINSKFLEKAQSFILNNTRLFNRENKYFVHGDFHLGNIFLYKKGREIKVKIIDWELYHLNNFSYDIAFFYSKLWQEPDLRREALNGYLAMLPKNKTSIFKILFKVNLLYYSAVYGIKVSPLELSQKKVLERQQWFKKLLFHSVDDFEIYFEI